jgi:pimeloyl-ACP methyl ester carboxylesterase
VTDLSPFVLVHGGRHGGWCWQRVSPILRRAGHEVFVLTLTGLGERSHLLRPEIDLSVHVQDLVATMEFEDISDAVVVAHSYGGMVVCGAMERIADRVRSLVFLDAQMPKTGESVFDIIGSERATMMTAMADRDGEGWYIPPSDASTYGVSDPGDLVWANARISAHPLASYLEPVGCTDRAWSHPGTYIECNPTAMEPHMLARPRERSHGDGRFRYRHLDAPHDAMITDPEALAALLLEAVDVQ